MSAQREETRIGGLPTEEDLKREREAVEAAAQQSREDTKDEKLTPEQSAAKAALAARDARQSILDEFSKLDVGNIEAKVISILDRGILHDRLHVELPPGIHGEWVRNDPLEIDRLQAIGFRDGTPFVDQRILHHDGQRGTIGDVTYMVCPQQVYDLIEKARHEKLIRDNGKPGDVGRKTREELEFEANNERSTSGVIKSETASRSVPARPKDVHDALSRMDDQTTPVRSI